MATLAAPIHSAEEAFNPNAVKVVLDAEGYALYFSRATIPWDRDRFAKSLETVGTPSCAIWAFTAIAPVLFAAMLTGSLARLSISKCWSSCECCGTVKNSRCRRKRSPGYRRRHYRRSRARSRRNALVFLTALPILMCILGGVSYRCAFPPLFFSSIDLIRVTSVCPTLIMKAVAFMRAI